MSAPTLVVMEATGGYHGYQFALAAALALAGISRQAYPGRHIQAGISTAIVMPLLCHCYAIVNSRRVRDFARATGTLSRQRTLAKTEPKPNNAVLRVHYEQLLRRDEQLLRRDEQLLRRGKAKKVALVVCMRKLLTSLNALLKTGTPWREPLSRAGRNP